MKAVKKLKIQSWMGEMEEIQPMEYKKESYNRATEQEIYLLWEVENE